jgi:hypothetical protein
VRRRILAALAIVATLAACAPQVAAPPETATPAPPGFPGAYYAALRAEGKPVLRIDPARSLVTVIVRRGGSLAQFGHDHVVASHDVSGFVAPGEGRADLFVPLAALVVDEPALRTAAGFTTQPSAADIAGTRSNMLAKVLDADRYPFARIAITGRIGDPGAKPLSIAITLHGVTRAMEIPVRLERSDGELRVEGTLALVQSDFGVAPFSILGGAIAVQDSLDLVFRIVARPME